MKNINKIVIKGSNEKTSDEQATEMISEMEKQFNTGPIIGEARDLLRFMAKNLMIRDLLMLAGGVSDTKKEEMFMEASELIEEMDALVLRKRR